MAMKPTAIESNATMAPPPDLPVTLYDAILAVVPKLGVFRSPDLPPAAHKRRFDHLIQVLPRSLVPSSFRSAYLTLAHTDPRAIYDAVERLARQNQRCTTPNLQFVKDLIHHMSPILRLRDVFMPSFEFDDKDEEGDYEVDEEDLEEGEEPPLPDRDSTMTTVAGAFALSLSRCRAWTHLHYLISQPWIVPDMWFEPVLHHLIRDSDDEGLAWWDRQELPITWSVPGRIVRPALRNGRSESLEWLLANCIEIKSTEYHLIEAGVGGGCPRTMDLIRRRVLGSMETYFDWEMASIMTDCHGGNNVQILEWARKAGIPFPEPRQMTDALDEAVSVHVLDWWLHHYLTTVDVQILGYTTIALDAATEKGDLERLNWWVRSGLELRFSPKAIKAAQGKSNLEEWWSQRIEYKFLSGAISLEEATEQLGFVPCRHWETLCAWGRVDVIDALDVGPKADEPHTSHFAIMCGIRTACICGQLGILDRFRSILDSYGRVQSWAYCARKALDHNQLDSVAWLHSNGYLRNQRSDWWASMARRVITGHGEQSVAMIEWMCKSNLLVAPVSESLIVAAVGSKSLRVSESQKRFPLLHCLWKHGGGFSVYSHQVTDKMIRMAVDAGCKEMIEWWLQKQSDILHDLHIELLSEAVDLASR